MSNLIKYDEVEYFSISDYKPIITYAGDVELFKKLESTLTQALPQEPTEWSRKFGPRLKTVTLSAVFRPFCEDNLQNENHYHLLEQPVLHVFWTQCSDVEVYKTVLHDEIKEWFRVLNRHDIFDDWLIVVVEVNDFRRHNKLLSRTTVLDKIKNDFGVKRVDRCLSVTNPLKSELRTGSSWRALVVNMRLLILTAYDNALLKFEEFIRKQRENRNQPGWNFCEYFLFQEELAFAFEMLGLYEDALIQYDELEALFNQFIRNSSLTDAPAWLSSFQIPVEHWRSISLTCKVNKSYREAIKNNHISLLDFRCYLFGRQAALLLFTSRPWDIAQRTLPFIHYCLNEIRILEINYPVGAIACWIFSCCLEIIYKCKNFNETAQVDACSLYTAPLMELAIVKLRELGELCGLMPDCEQTSEQLHTVVSLSAGIGDSLRFLNTNAVNPVVDKLKEALSSKDAYCKHYLELCEQAMITYKHKERIRSARYIGKELADFRLRMGDLTEATGFLVNALSSYEEDNWPVLANQIRLQLLQCYKQMNETEKLLRTNISIACSPSFNLPFQMTCFNDVMRIIQEQNDLELIIPLEESFSVESVVVEVQQTGLRAHATLNIINKFSSDIVCSNMLISISDCSNNDIHKAKKNVAADLENITVKNFKNNTKVNAPSQLPLVYILDHQQDKSLAGVRIICKNSDGYLRRQDSQKLKKPNLPSKTNFSRALTLSKVVLKPGSNTVTLVSQEEESSNTYGLGQLCLIINDKLNFLSSSNYFSKVKFTIKHVPPKVSIQTTNDCTLLVGIHSMVNLCIHMGTHILNEDTVIKARTSSGLKISSSKEKNVQNELEINLRHNGDNAENSFCIPLIVCSEFPSTIDNSVVDYKLWLNCPWSESEVCLIVQFCVPFIAVRRIHTAKLRKFLLVTITGSIKESIILTDPELLLVSDEKISLKSLNPTSRQFIVYNKTKVKFLWELMPEASAVDKCALCFTVKYDVLDETSMYKCEFQISNFMTLYSVESTVDPMRGCEFCRVNTMCHLVFTVKKVSSTTDHSLKYEVVTDQAMWAVCNMSTGVIILDETDKCSKTVDLMPLVHGYLPIPLIKLSKYFHAEANIGSSPRLEPFYHGQVFNASKSTQVQVLPSTNLPD